MYRVTADENFTDFDAQNKVKQQIEWIAQSNVDAILITCTNYIALLKEDQLSIPIIKIDEPFFEYISNVEQRQIILFTNPATVTGTMDRLYQYSNKTLNIEVVTLEDTFEFIMRGLKDEYNEKLTSSLLNLAKENKPISVAQLSMVDAAKKVEQMTNQSITNPLDTLVSYVIEVLGL